MHPRERVDEVLRLVAAGWNDCQISRATGINRRTVLDWRHGRIPRSARPESASGPPRRCPICDGASLDEPAYAYLLGLYLGDGWISQPRTAVLRIVQDARYEHLIRLAIRTIQRVRGPGSRVGRVTKVGCIEICAWWKHWPCLFPQHGPGRKHHRTIRLVDWQRRIVHRYPRQLLRGALSTRTAAG